MSPSLPPSPRSSRDTTPPLDLDAFAGHTPGPWASNLVPEVYAVREPGNCPEIASLPWSRMEKQGKRGEVLANAALIAAAPALLAECRRLRARERELAGALSNAAAGFAVASNQTGASHPGLADADNLSSVRGFLLENFHQCRAALDGQGVA